MVNVSLSLSTKKEIEVTSAILLIPRTLHEMLAWWLATRRIAEVILAKKKIYIYNSNHETPENPSLPKV